jgi:hypothetical protein
MRCVTWMLTCGLLACGGGGPKMSTIDDDLASLPDTNRKSLQLYLVLTADPAAMQGKPAVAAMWKAVGGEGARYQAVRRHVKWVPGSYELDVTLDFADLPHAAVSPEAIEPMLKGLSASAKTKARDSKLAVFVRSRTGVLPDGNHIRLAGLAALYAADTYDGIVVDLLARRAWTADAWHAELSTAPLSKAQVRLTSRFEGKARWLLSRGNPKYGSPDLQMRGIDPAALDGARAHFIAVQEVVVVRGGKPGDTVPVGAERVTLHRCEAPKGLHDDACVQIDPP